MDPITALSVAAAALQFVSFSLEALELCRQIRDDAEGATAANKALEASTKELNGALQDLKTQVAADTSQTGKRIKKITSDCLALENDLNKLLEEVRGAAGKKPFGPLNATFKAIKANKKIERLKNALKDRLAALERAINHDIRARVGQIGRQQDQQSKLVRDKFDELLGNVHKQQQTATQSFQDIDRRLSTVTSQNTRMEQVVHSSRDTIVHNLHDVQGHVGKGFDALQTQRAKDVLIKSLWYPEHELRRTMVKPPTLRTFDWIFDKDEGPSKSNSRNVAWSNFPKWLREGTSLYWISGKAASGKSTLMAHICNHPKNKTNLNIWAAGKLLHLLCYFFWRPGSDLQKNVQGLLRSLLLQIISEIPEITERLGPEFLAHADMAPVWSTQQLVAMFERALAISDGLKHCFCIFIDGLDEFEGDTEELLELIFRLYRRPNIKCCVSSRPETQLKHRLSGYATLKLEDLNRDDIEIYVRKRIGAYQLSAHIAREIVGTISSRASGVFLWVVLVTKSLIRGIEAHDDAALLIKRLDTYPRDMNELLKKMLEDVDEVHKQSLSFVFNAQMMFSRHNESLSIALLTVARGQNPLDYYAFTRECEATEKQIIAQSRGLLEVCSDDDYDIELGRKLSENTTRSEIRRQLSKCIVPDQIGDRDARLPLGTPTDRQQAFSTRHLATPTQQTGQLIMLQHRNVQWIHRCAYDFMLLHGSNYIMSFSNRDVDSGTCQRLADASVKLVTATPWIGSFNKVSYTDECNTYDPVFYGACHSFDKCCDELLVCMRYAEDSTATRFIELESLIDLLDGEVIEALGRRSASSAIDNCESHMRSQYHQEVWKTRIWIKALDSGYFNL